MHMPSAPFRRAGSTLAALVVGLLGCFSASQAQAQLLDVYGIALKLGLRGGASIPYIAEPEADRSLFPHTPYSDYFGLGWNVGGAINLRVFSIAAVEIGVLYAQEEAEGTIELTNVRRCREVLPDGQLQGPCKRQQVEHVFQQTNFHIPVQVQLYLPLGVASPFISGGIDIVTNRSGRSVSVRARDPLPASLDPNDPIEAAMLSEWDNDGLATNITRMNSTANGALDPSSPDTFLGLTVGAGLNMAIGDVEIPVEFRAAFYPAAGGTMLQRGTFGEPCLGGECPFDPNSNAPLYRDVWSSQFFVMFGLDYLIF